MWVIERSKIFEAFLRLLQRLEAGASGSSDHPNHLRLHHSGDEALYIGSTYRDLYGNLLYVHMKKIVWTGLITAV